MELIYHKIAEILKTKQKAALCTIVGTTGSTPLKAGAKMLVLEDGSIFGTIGGGNLEKATIENALSVIKTKECKNSGRQSHPEFFDRGGIGWTFKRIYSQTYFW